MMNLYDLLRYCKLHHDNHVIWCEMYHIWHVLLRIVTDAQRAGLIAAGCFVDLFGHTAASANGTCCFGLWIEIQVVHTKEGIFCDFDRIGLLFLQANQCHRQSALCLGQCQGRGLFG